MITTLQKSDSTDEKAEIDATLANLVDKVGLPADSFEKLSLNDSFRLEQKIGLILFLDKTGQTFEGYE